MSNITNPIVHVTLDRELITRRGGVRHLLVDVQAPETERPDETQRPPLELALVVDASGSMSGAPLQAAKEAACGVVQALGKRDRITVVSFAGEVQVHVAAQAMGDGGRDAALRALDELKPRGCTDLHGGWETGVAVLEHDPLSGAQRRVVLLSDGYANQGETDPEILGREAAAARERGVITSTVGIGDGYSTAQLAALSEHGGGALHHAARAREIIEVVVGELGQILKTACESFTLRLDAPSNVSAEAVGPYPVRRTAEGFDLAAGSFLSGASRRIVVRLHCPPGVTGDAVAVLVTPTWRVPGGEADVCGETLEARVTYATTAQVAAEEPDLEACREIALAWQRDLIAKATRMVDEGDREGAVGFLKEARRGVRAYVRDLPGGRSNLELLDRFLKRLRRPMSRGLAKEVSCLMMQDCTYTRDLRAGGGMSWDELESRE